MANVPAGNPGAYLTPEPIPPTPVTTPLPIGTYLVAGVVSIALSDTQFAPLIAAFLGAAIVYNGVKILGTKGGGTTLQRAASNAVTPPTTILV